MPSPLLYPATVVPFMRRRPLSARGLPRAITPGDPDLLRARRPPDAFDAGRRLEAIVALEARRAQARSARGR